jgi:phosphatidate cytidylyltransferase
VNTGPLARRLLSAAALVVVVAAALWVGGVVFDVVLTVTVGAAVWEWGELLSRIGAAPPAWLIYPLSAWLLLRFLLPGDVPALELGLGTAVVVGLLGGLVFAGASMARFASAVAGALYLGLTMGYYVALFRWRSPDAGHFGMRLIVLTIGTAIVGDSVAYFGGTAFGRHRFFPALSPSKSIEGAVAGAAAAVVWTVVAGPALIGLAPYHAAALGILLTVAAQSGDLVESALKRQAGVKDSSSLIPGHGGVLDRLDSLLLLGPVVYCYLRVIALR